MYSIRAALTMNKLFKNIAHTKSMKIPHESNQLVITYSSKHHKWSTVRHTKAIHILELQVIYLKEVCPQSSLLDFIGRIIFTLPNEQTFNLIIKGDLHNDSQFFKQIQEKLSEADYHMTIKKYQPALLYKHSKLKHSQLA